MIKVDKLIKSFHDGEKELVVLKELNLRVKGGEFISITGRSGSGKSTLLYQLGLLDHPNSGQILIDDIDVLALNPTERTRFRLQELGYIFQDYALLPEMNAEENVMLPLLMQGLTKRKARDMAVKALEKIGLGPKLDNLPSQLSGGEQQRVSIARAIAHDPKIIFADEPTANLDADTSQVVLDYFLELHREGQTIVMVTHEPEYARLTDRILLLSDGVIDDKEGIDGHKH
jgi:putative ABC transport system ATP-binding protein